MQIREKARELFQAAGIDRPFHPGVRSEEEIDLFLRGHGFTKLTTVILGAGQSTTPREFLRRLAEGELSYIWNVPQDVRDFCLPILQQWVGDTFSMDSAIVFPREVTWAAYRTHAA